MEPSQQLIDELYRERIERARRIPPAQRVVEGLRHSVIAVEVMRDGIREQCPDADEKKINDILIRRVNRLRLLEDMR